MKNDLFNTEIDEIIRASMKLADEPDPELNNKLKATLYKESQSCRCRNTHSHNGSFHFLLRRKLKGLFLMFGAFDNIFFNIFCSSGGSL